MKIYSFLFIDTEEHISRSSKFECLTDEWAIGAAALQAGDCRAVQIWDGDRPVAMIANPRNREKLSRPTTGALMSNEGAQPGPHRASVHTLMRSSKPRLSF
jgi:hypothetical protein